MVLVLKQTGEPMEPNQRPRHDSTYLWTPDFWKSQKYTMEKKKASSTNGTGVTGC